MNPITHFLVGWVGLERIVPSMRDRGLIAIAGVLPDLDGVGIVVDFSTRMLGLPPTDYYQHYHRLLGHGLPAAIMIAALVAGFGRNRRAVFGLALLAVHLHLLCDIVGSRGSTPLDLWPIYYFAPLSLQPEFSWSGQWPLIGWQNFVITAALLAITLLRSARTGYSPVGLLSARADLELIQVIRRRLGQVRERDRRD